jgi:hypothetical protein
VPPARPIYWEVPNEQLFFVSQAIVCVVFLASRAAQRQKRAFFSIFYVVTKINPNAIIKASDGTKLQLTSRGTPLRVISKYILPKKYGASCCQCFTSKSQQSVD